MRFVKDDGRIGPPGRIQQAQRKNPSGSTSNRAWIKEDASVIVPVGGGQGPGGRCWNADASARIQAVTSPGLVVAVGGRAGPGVVTALPDGTNAARRRLRRETVLAVP
jgi:hypothetical protein